MGHRKTLRIRELSKLILLFTLALLIIPPPGWSQNDKKAESELRTVHGTVVDKDETPVASSVVYLLNMKTDAVRTYVADEMGLYRFSGLDPNVDYEIHAEHNDMTSATRTISSFNSQREIDITLKLTHKKTDH